MPFKSEAQRRFMYAKHPDLAAEFEAATPKGKLPERVAKKAHALGVEHALARYKLGACEEIRLKLPKREYHGLDEAMRSVGRGEKRAEGPTAEQLAEVLREFDEPMAADHTDAAKDPLDRSTLWSGPSNLAAGDTANRVSDMGQTTQNGTVF